MLACVIVAGCGGNGNAPPPVATCSVSQLEADMDTALRARALSGAADPSDSFYYPFSFAVERQDGRRYNFNWAGATLQTSYESASTSKLVSAVIILRLVEQGYLNLSDKPQDRVTGWPIVSTDPLYNMNLAQLLSFTSGLETEPLCLNASGYDLAGNEIPGFFENCVKTIASDNALNGQTPGQRFYYASTHLQVAGLMAVKARGVASWQDVFAEFQAQTGLFPTSTYDLPSSVNPRLAGGMHWTAGEYLAFLGALRSGALLNADSMTQLLADHTASAVMANSPPLAQLGEDWHYGFGLWHECQSAAFDCTPGARVSSPGAYGAYPYWDRGKGYFGMVAREEKVRGSFPDGVNIERFMRPAVEQWVACQ